MPDEHTVMQGFPPASDAQVTLENWREPPYNRWAFHHVSQIVPCATVWRGGEVCRSWRAEPKGVTDIQFAWQGRSMSVGQMLVETATDGFVVLSHGNLAHESYGGGLQPHVPHILFSVSKAVLGLLTGIVIERGQLALNRPLASYLPELSGSGYTDATVRDLLDMTVGIGFDEDYTSPTGEMARYREASDWSVGDPREAIGMRRYLATLPADGSHGRTLKYCSPNADLLGWVLERATGQPYASLLSEALWARIGAEENAYIAVDGYGSARASGGLCTTTRDLARLGQMVLDLGRVEGEPVVPEAWLKDIQKGGDSRIWEGGSFDGDLPDTRYRSLWYTHGEDLRAIVGMGIYGQALYVHPASRTVIAKHSSQPAPLNFELEAMQRAAFEAVAQSLG